MPDLETQLDIPVTTSLQQLLVDRIIREGPITFHDWMNAALYTPLTGYYKRTDLQRWGREGDYRTSPERSELFAATFARYFNHLYQELDQPTTLAILECGAGNGMFAHGVLSYLRQCLPDVFEATRYLIDEVSEYSQDRIGQKLSDFADRVDLATSEESGPLDTAVVFSNEFLDAFPVHRLKMVEGKLRELYVAVDAQGEFAWSTGDLSNSWLQRFVSELELQMENQQVIEVSPAIETWFEELAKKVKRGYVISVDYGHDQRDLYDFMLRPEGTLRAYSRHRFENVLECPGDFDITTSVNWTYVKRCGLASGFSDLEFERLDQFLVKAGLLDEVTIRLERLTSDSDKLRMTTAAREMILPGGMATSFQVLVQQRL